jgi:hypothetical protein
MRKKASAIAIAENFFIFSLPSKIQIYHTPEGVQGSRLDGYL